MRSIAVMVLLLCFACTADDAPTDGVSPMGSSTATSVGPTNSTTQTGSMDTAMVTPPTSSAGTGGEPGLFCPDVPSPEPHYVLGWEYKDGWHALPESSPLVITIGGQGAWMIPLGVRGDGFCVPADPFDYERVPVLDIRIEAEGDLIPIAEVKQFPVSFEPVDDGDLALGYTFIPMLLRDNLEVVTLHGIEASLRSELRVHGLAPLGFERRLVLMMSE